MATITLDQFRAAAATLPTKTIHVPALGGEVVIRALSRAQHLAAVKASEVTIPAAGATPPRQETDANLLEAKIIALGLVEPAVSEADVAALREGPSGIIQSLSTAIMTLSGIGDQVSEAVKSPGA